MKTAKETKPMITDKDMKEAKAIIKAERDDKGFTVESIAALFARIRVESAEQARKEAADRYCEKCGKCEYEPEGISICVLRAAILGDSFVRENLTTDSEKLAIALKALEALYGWIKAEVTQFGATCPDDFIVEMVDSALKEIQK
jgi:hypothetical protein